MNNQNITPSVAIIMGSQSDWETMKFSEEILIKLKIPPPVPKIVSPSSTISIFMGKFLFSIKLIIFSFK